MVMSVTAIIWRFRDEMQTKEPESNHPRSYSNTVAEETNLELVNSA